MLPNGYRCFGQHAPKTRALFVPLSVILAPTTSLNRMNTGAPHSSWANSHRRKPKLPSLAVISSRRRRYGPPPTPLSQWKFFDDGKLVVSGRGGGGQFRRARFQVSARKLAAGLWQLRFTDVSVGAGSAGCGTCDRVGSQLKSSSPCTKCSMEGPTKWEPGCSKVSGEVYQFYGRMKLLEDQANASTSVVSDLKAALVRAQTRIRELEFGERSYKKKVKHLLRKVEDERISGPSKEQRRIYSVVDGLMDELGRERKCCQRMEILNSKLVSELANAKLSAKQIMQNNEDEKRSREIMEEVCIELAHQIEQEKTKVEALRKESMRIRQEVEEEREMFQLAEIWREERVQMKLVDAKLALEDRYCQMSKLIMDLETFLLSKTSTLDVMELRKAEVIQHSVKPMSFQDVKEFLYVPPKPADIFSGELREGEANEETELYSKIHTLSTHFASSKNVVPKHSKDVDTNSTLEEESKGWDCASHAEDQGSTYSLQLSDASGKRMSQGVNVFGSRTGCNENAEGDSVDTEIGEVCLLPAQQSMQEGCPSNDELQRIILRKGYANGKVSSNAVVQQSSALVSLNSDNPHITRGMKGCVEWPQGVQRHNLKPRPVGVRMGSQKSQLRHILDHASQVL